MTRTSAGRLLENVGTEVEQAGPGFDVIGVDCDLGEKAGQKAGAGGTG
jgi:hypothetical protein